MEIRINKIRYVFFFNIPHMGMAQFSYPKTTLKAWDGVHLKLGDPEVFVEEK